MASFYFHFHCPFCIFVPSEPTDTLLSSLCLKSKIRIDNSCSCFCRYFFFFGFVHILILFICCACVYAEKKIPPFRIIDKKRKFNSMIIPNSVKEQEKCVFVRECSCACACAKINYSDDTVRWSAIYIGAILSFLVVSMISDVFSSRASFCLTFHFFLPHEKKHINLFSFYVINHNYHIHLLCKWMWLLFIFRFVFVPSLRSPFISRTCFGAMWS